jgi:hypothetical protein
MWMCGYITWGLGYLIVAVVVSVALGIVAHFLTPRMGEDRVPILIAVSVFLIMILGCCGYWGWCESNFNCSRGIGDYYRIPLKYPYQISAIDVLDEGCLDIWGESNSTIVCGITDYTVRFSVMVGKISKPFSAEYFSFNLDTGELIYYSSSREFIDACQEFGFAGMPMLQPVPEHFGEH